MKVNLNDQVEVVLTKFGAKTYNEHLQQYNIASNKKEGDLLIEHLWQLMRIFGPTIMMGMHEVPFKGNTISFV